jgi:formiminoglutamase
LASIFGADFSALSITPSHADLAPSTIRLAAARFSTWDAERRVDLTDWHVADHGDAGSSRMAWNEAFDAIRGLAAAALDGSPFVIGLGGDHSVSWPIISAVAEKHNRVGVIQLDVHHDVRPLDNGPSNGTPVRGLIESNFISPADIVQIGIHPLGNKRVLTEYCDAQGIRRFSLEDIRKRGMKSVAAAARENLAECDALYLTVDIDVLDRSFAPGTVAALPGGITPIELITAISHIVSDHRTVGMDIVEFDPSRDVSDCTAYNAAHALISALVALADRS